MHLVQIYVVWVACGALAALMLLCLAWRLRADPPGMHALRGVPTACLAALVALASALGSRAVPKNDRNVHAAGRVTRPRTTAPSRALGDELRFTSIAVSSNSVALEVAWPTSLFPSGTTLDLFRACAHTGRWEWVEAAAPPAASTSHVFSVSRTGVDTNGFFRVSDRSSCAVTMEDADGDGIPDVYELANGTNPYVPDYAAAPKIVAGSEGGASNLVAAIAESVPYSIIEIASGVHEGAGWAGIRLPAHPVLITSPDGGRSRACTLRNVTSPATFYLDATQRTETVVQGLNIDLLGTGGLQVAFWCGGDLPWAGLPAAGTFRNLSIRMPNPRVDYRGWFFRHWESNEVVIASCVVNAAGATRARGIAAVDSPPMSVENCTFVNFPSAASPSLGYGIQYETTSGNIGGAPERIPVEIVNCVFDPSFTNAYAIVMTNVNQEVAYHVTMMNCIVPSPLEYEPDAAFGLCATNALVSWCGHLLACSPAIDFGTEVLRSSFDVDGQDRCGHPDAGADERVYLGPHDTDGDGLADADEIDLYGTDPFRADSDFDGASDGDEVTLGTDPVNPASYPQTISVTVTNTVSDGIASYVAWGFSSEGWETNGLAALPSGSGVVAYTNDAAWNVACVKAFSDIDGNGAYDDGVDVILARPVTHAQSIDFSFAFGDVDGDGFADALERAEGTDPYGDRSYCFSLSATFTGVFHTTNSLTASAEMAGEVRLGPETATNATFTLAGHVVTTNGGPLVVYFWDDANSNGVREAHEAAVTNHIMVMGHETCVTNRLARGVFDRDNDRMLDWWEIAHGLSPANSADALVDDDGDGLLNLHEFWTGTDPASYDGTNTAIYAAVHGIDDRIAGKNPASALPLYISYKDNLRTNNPPLTVINPDSWVGGMLAGCFSVWCGDQTYYYGNTLNMISTRHALIAAHCDFPTNIVYKFQGISGAWYPVSLIAKRRIYNTDVSIGIIDSPVPTNDVRVVGLLPRDYMKYLGDLTRLPVVQVDQDKNALVQEIVRTVTPQDDVTKLKFACGPGTSVRSDFYQDIAMYDSGHPCYLVIGDVPVLLYSLQGRYPSPWLHYGAGFNTILLADEVQAAMDELSDDTGLPRESFKTIDLTGWPQLENGAFE